LTAAIRRRLVALLMAPFLAGIALVSTGPVPATAAGFEDWPTFLHDTARSGGSGETILNTANAPLLKKRFSYLTGGLIASSAAIVAGVAYVGSWDGYEYAIDARLGTLKWRTFLGQTVDPACHPPTIGITSGAAVLNNVVYVGGGDAYWYALDSATGAVLWKVFTGDNSQAGAHYNWSSPLLANGNAYIGIASNCDAPLVQGQLMQVNLATHQVVNTVSFVPDGQVGGGVWTSPTLDPATNSVFVSTGTLNLQTQTMSEAIVQVDVNTLAIRSVWQLPRDQAGLDTDWGTTPTLMTDRNGRLLLAAANKNGVLYAFDRTNLAAGPVWQRTIAIGGDCPPCGDGSISSGNFANGTLYYAGGNTSINGVGYQGAVRAIDPATGALLWEHGTDKAVIPAIAYDNGLVIDAEGPVLEVLDAATGHSLYDFSTGGIPIFSAPSVSGGIIYFGGGDGNLYAINIGAAIVVPPDANCPAGWTCQDIRNPAPGSETLANGILTVTAAGAAIHGTADQFRLISRPVGGEAQITTKLLGQSVQGPTPQAGLMMRQSADATAPFYSVLEYPNDLPNGLPQPVIRVWYRTTFGGNAIQANKYYPMTYPEYMRVVRVGNTFAAGLSQDNVHWQILPGSQTTIVMPWTVLDGLATDSSIAGTTGTATYNFANTVIGAVTPLPAVPTPTPCPAGWNCADVGAPSPVGDQALNGTTWTLQGTGPDITNTFDQFHFVWQPMPADGTVSAHVTTQQNTSANAKAGLMLRQTLDWGSPYYGVFVTPGKGIVVQWRQTSNLRTLTVPIPGAAPTYLQISRYTDPATSTTYYSAFTSTDGTTWSVVLGSTMALPLTGTLLAGMAADANAPRVLSAVTMDTVSITGTAARPPTICPFSWSCTDIGTATPHGDQVVQNGQWTMSAGGSDIWIDYDLFRFAYQTLQGDGTVSARVLSESGGEWQKAGVMLRFSTDPSSPYYAAFVTPLHGIAIQFRTAQGALTNQLLVPGTAPAYLQIGRSTDPRTGSTYYSTYTSPDGQAWTLVAGSSVILQMPGFLLAGLAADSYNGATAQAALDSVAIGTTDPSPSVICPAPWSCLDVNAAQPAGAQAVSGGNWSLQGGGGDIWGAVDNFRYAYQSITGDGAISAHLSSQTNTDPWAKGGLMMRLTTDPGSPYYAVFVTPGNGLAMQYRAAQAGASTQVLAVGNVPNYLKIARASNSFIAYSSPDGTTWTAIQGSSVSLPSLQGTVLVGLAVSSHNTLLLSTVAYDTIVFATSAPPPVITSVQSTPSWASATIAWYTDTLSDSQVEYGLTTAYGSTTTLDPTLGNIHSHVIAGLSPTTTYHFRVRSRDASGQLTVSTDFTFTTVVSPCPASWNCADIGNPAPAGGETVSAGTWTVQGGGGDIWGTMDTFQYENQTLAGNGTVSAHIAAQGNTDPWAKAGVMVRASSDPGAAYYAAFITPGYGVDIQYRLAQGGVTSQVLAAGTAPTYLEVARAGMVFTTYSSTDGLAWTAVAGSSTTVPALTGALLDGLAVTSHNVTALSTVTFDTVTTGASARAPLISNVQTLSVAANAATITWTTDTLSSSQIDYSTDTSYGTSTVLDATLTTTHSETITGLAPSTLYNYRVDSRDSAGQLSTAQGFSFATTPSTCPAAWNCGDVGNPAPIGNESVNAGTWSIDGGGADIWGTADAFHYDWQALPANGTISARIASQGNTNMWAKAGIMVRLTTDAGSPYYAVFLTPSNGIAVQDRLVQGGNSGQVLMAGTAPTYLEIARAGSIFTAYLSPDGTTWTAVPGSSVSIPSLAGPLLAGMAVTSHNVAAVSVATFDTVTFGTTVPAPVLSLIQATHVQQTTGTIGWSTDTLSDSQVNYGLTAAYGSSTLLDGTLVTAHAQAIGNLTLNTLYHFQILSRDAAGQLVTSPDQTFTTAPLPPAISAVQASNIDANDATITWTTDTASDSQVQYGLTTAYGGLSPLGGALVTGHSVVLSGLTPNTTYHFSVLSRDAFGQLSMSPDFTVATPNPPPPVISAVQATGLTQTGATITWTTSTPTSSQVNYGLTTAYGSSTTLDPTLVTNHSQVITGLTLNTTYHFQVQGTDQIGQQAISTDATFTTLPAAPVVSAVTASVTSATSATITWTTDTASSSTVNYGLTTAYGSTSVAAPMTTAHSIVLTGLTPNSTYHFQVQSTDSFGQTTSAADGTFATPLPAPPTISAVSATPTAPTTATIGWTTDSASTSQVNYGTTTAYGSSTVQDPTLATSHSQGLTGLSPNTTYHAQVVSVDAYGQPSTSADVTFTTPKPPPAVISNVQVTGITNTTATVTWTTDIVSTSQVNFGLTTAYGSSTVADPTMVTTHSQTLTGLTPGQTYHLQVVSTDSYAQVSASTDASFATIPSAPVISNTQATAITNSGATITWTTSTPANSQVSFGTTTAYGSTTALNPALVTGHSQALTGLAPSTTYHVQVASTDAYGQQTLSADFTFTTLPLPPAITNVQVSGATASTATITWTTSTPATSQVNYGVTTGYGASTAQDPALVTTHAQTLTGLQAVTTYHIQVVSVDAYGQTSSSGDVIFTTTSCPNTWGCADIGNPTVAGGQTVNGGIWTITASGADIFGTADQFHFDWQTVAGDGSVSARVTAQTNTSGSAKAGVMIRQTTDPGAPYFGVFVTPANGIKVQYRTTQGGNTATQTTVAGTVPTYLDVIRSGNTFQAYTSTDGLIWTVIPNSSKNIAIAGPMLAGLAVTSHNATAIGQATFDTVVISNTGAPPAAPCPAGWSCGDIGGALPAGNQALTAGAWTIMGGGADIGGAADQSHYVWQALAADGSVSAHVTAQTNTNGAAKAGVMLRQTSDPGSPYYAAFITPTQVVVQMRTVAGGVTTQVTTAVGAVPIYLKITRAATTFTAYTSTDGVTWTLIANSTKVIAIAGGMLQGMAVTSHNVGAQSTGKFDTVVTS
jgi:hypothetical protein